MSYKASLKMSIGVPDEYENAPADYTRTFFFGRVHNGLASIISETTATTMSISSDKFSTYALAYSDTKNQKDYNDYLRHLLSWWHAYDKSPAYAGPSVIGYVEGYYEEKVVFDNDKYKIQLRT